MIFSVASISVTGNPPHDGAFAEGSNVQLYCSVELSTTTRNFTIVWSRNGGSHLHNDSNYVIISLTDAYNSILTIKQIGSEDNDAYYTCTSYIENFFSNDVEASDNLYLRVASKCDCLLLYYVYYVYYY